MRIISGFLKNRKLIDSSKHRDLRPTTDKNRQALFNILSSAKFLSEIDFSLQDAKVLDLCCGTGSVAFEAISRGAKSAILIDKSAAHIEIAKENAANFGLQNCTEFLCCDVAKLNLSDKEFDLIFLDPPYEIKPKLMVEKILAQNILNKNSLLIVESSDEQNFSDLGLKTLDLRRYGISWFGFFALEKQSVDL